jgi:hypothetical protein
MNRREFLKASAAAAGLLSPSPLSASRVLSPPFGRQEGTRECYRPGDQVEASVSFLDRDQQVVTLADQVDEYSKVLCLVIFGGAYARKPADKRGQLWCVDSSDDLAIQRTLYFNYVNEGVTFIPIATPPVYSGASYGYPADVFLVESDDSPRYQSAVSEFVEKTEALKDDGTIPYDPIFYDPRFRLLDNPSEHVHVSAYGPVYPWQGRFKWYQDHQRYGTPTIWLLDTELRVLREPFWGNVYEAVPVEINYTVRDVMAAFDQALARASGR